MCCCANFSGRWLAIKEPYPHVRALRHKGVRCVSWHDGVTHGQPAASHPSNKYPSGSTRGQTAPSFLSRASGRDELLAFERGREAVERGADVLPVRQRLHAAKPRLHVRIGREVIADHVAKNPRPTPAK